MKINFKHSDSFGILAIVSIIVIVGLVVLFSGPNLNSNSLSEDSADISSQSNVAGQASAINVASNSGLPVTAPPGAGLCTAVVGGGLGCGYTGCAPAGGLSCTGITCSSECSICQCRYSITPMESRTVGHIN